MTLPRILTLLAATLALLAVVPSAQAQTPSAPSGHGRVVLAFLPDGGEDNPAPVLDRLPARPELAFGLMSMTQGRYSPSQSLLDMTAGTRTSAAAYDPENTPHLETVEGGDGRAFIFNWGPARERADTALAEISPGLLASALPGGVGYSGLTTRKNAEAIVAADRSGRIADYALGRAADQPAEVRSLLRRHRLVVVSMATGDKGDRTLDALVRDRRPEDLLIVVQAPPGRRALQLLPVGVAGLPGGRGALTSATTHLEGIVAAIDITATVLDHVGIKEPKGVKGQDLEVDGPRNVDSLASLVARLKVVSGRRNPTLFALLFSWLGLVLVLGLFAQDRGIRAGMRIGGLGVMWVLPLLLLAGALNPSRTPEILLVVGGALALGAITDRLVRWPLAPAVPSAVTFVAYAADLAYGSPLIVRSLLGVNPRSGSRFYGLGNELEAVLATLVLIGVAALLTRRERSTRAAATFAGAGVLLGAVVGAGRLGADVGGVITVGSGTAFATVLMLPGRLTTRRVILAVLVPVAGLAALALLDLATGGNGHFTRTILRADSGQALWDVVERRYTIAYNVLARGAMPFITILAALAAAYAVRYRERIFAPLGGSPAWVAGLAGALVGAVVGSLTNDSGPILLVFGAFVMAAATAYVRGDPALGDEGSSDGRTL